MLQILSFKNSLLNFAKKTKFFGIVAHSTIIKLRERLKITGLSVSLRPKRAERLAHIKKNRNKDLVKTCIGIESGNWDAQSGGRRLQQEKRLCWIIGNRGKKRFTKSLSQKEIDFINR